MRLRRKLHRESDKTIRLCDVMRWPLSKHTNNSHCRTKQILLLVDDEKTSYTDKCVSVWRHFLHHATVAHISPTSMCSCWSYWSPASVICHASTVCCTCSQQHLWKPFFFSRPTKSLEITAIMGSSCRLRTFFVELEVENTPVHGYSRNVNAFHYGCFALLRWIFTYLITYLLKMLWQHRVRHELLESVKIGKGKTLSIAGYDVVAGASIDTFRCCHNVLKFLI